MGLGDGAAAPQRSQPTPGPGNTPPHGKGALPVGLRQRATAVSAEASSDHTGPSKQRLLPGEVRAMGRGWL